MLYEELISYDKNNKVQLNLSFVYKFMDCGGDCDNCPHREACQNGEVPESIVEALNDIKDSLENCHNKILVLSGKGGVGKSTVSYLISKYFSESHTVGVLDADLCGPSLPILFNAPTEPLLQSALGIQPYPIGDKLELVSTQFFLENKDDAVIARGPMKNQLILQFLRDVNWGEIDFLVVDTPPGTSDEHLSIVNFMKEAGIDGAVIVTTPEEMSLADVRREIQFCRRAGVNILGVVENMSSFICPKCNNESSIYPRTTGGAEELCKNEQLDLLGKISIDPLIISGCVGENYQISEQTYNSVALICHNILEKLNLNHQ